MSYRVDVLDFIEMINNQDHFSISDIGIKNNLKDNYFRNYHLSTSINQEVVKDDLVVVKANYCMKDDVILDCFTKESFLELHFNLSGSGINYKNPITTSQVVAPMTGNMIYVEPSDEKSEIIFCKEIDYNTFDIHFPIKMLNEYEGENKMLDKFLNQIVQHKSVGLTDNAISLNSKILLAIQDIQYCCYEGFIRKMYIESKVREIIAYSFEGLNDNYSIKLSTRDVDCIKYAAQLIHADINHPLTIKEISKKIGINETKLKVGFKSVFGTTVFGYLQDLRMNEAKRYLLDTELTIEEVSQKCGYINLSNFSNAFKKYYSYSPSIIRNENNLLKKMNTRISLKKFNVD